MGFVRVTKQPDVTYNEHQFAEDIYLVDPFKLQEILRERFSLFFNSTDLENILRAIEKDCVMQVTASMKVSDNALEKAEGIENHIVSELSTELGRQINKLAKEEA